jgi:hypothetical protein
MRAARLASVAVAHVVRMLPCCLAAVVSEDDLRETSTPNPAPGVPLLTWSRTRLVDGLAVCESRMVVLTLPSLATYVSVLPPESWVVKKEPGAAFWRMVKPTVDAVGTLR